MTTLEQRIEEVAAGLKGKIPPEAKAVMHQATEDLRALKLLEQIPKVGEPLPSFALHDSAGETVQLEDLLARGPLVVSFYRGRWCPYCNEELKALQEVYAEVQAAGAELVVISPQTVANNAATKRQLGLEFPLLSDTDNAYAKELSIAFELPAALREVYGAFGIDVGKANGTEAWELPVPSRIVLTPDGVIQSWEADEDYRVRPEPSDTVQKLAALPAAS